MPRKPWKVRATRPTVPENFRRYLETGESERGDADVFLLQGNTERVRALWREVGGEIVASWIQRSPCTRPVGWWWHDAPQEPVPGWPEFHAAQRLRLGGVGTPQHDTIATSPRFDRGIPISWFDAEGAALFGGVAVNDADPPRYEAEAEFLRRHNFLTPAEIRHLEVHPELLEPEPVVFDEDEDPTTDAVSDGGGDDK